jgi:hypothetical protein
LEFNSLALEFDCPNLEVDTDSRDIALGVGIVCKAEEQAGLADT